MSLMTTLNSLLTALVEAVRDDAADPSYRRKLRISDFKAKVIVASTENMASIMSPHNTLRKPPREVGDRYIAASVGLQGMEFTVFEVGKDRYKLLGQWSGEDQGPTEFKDLPVMFNDFPYFPEFT